MFKDLKVLEKSKFSNVKFSEVDAKEVGKHIGLIPLSFNEVLDASCSMPVVIMNDEFLAVTGINENVNIFNKDEVFIPAFLKTYPFLNIKVKNEKDEIIDVIGIDEDDKFVGEDKELSIFDKDLELKPEAFEKISLLRWLNTQRAISKEIIKGLKDNNLLLKRDFKLKIDNNERVLLSEFYVTDREKFTKLSDEILSDWAKKGWSTVIDMHIKSMSKFNNIFIQKKEDTNKE